MVIRSTLVIGNMRTGLQEPTFMGFNLKTLSACAGPCRCDEEEVEDDVKRRSAAGEAMGAKTLCLPLEQPELPEGTPCFASGKPAKNWALWGRSY